MAYDPFYTLLNLIYYYFIENFLHLNSSKVCFVELPRESVCPWTVPGTFLNGYYKIQFRHKMIHVNVWLNYYNIVK